MEGLSSLGRHSPVVLFGVQGRVQHRTLDQRVQHPARGRIEVPGRSSAAAAHPRVGDLPVSGVPGHPVNLVGYLQLSWLATSLGTLAGALGSNSASEETVREATCSRRVHQRRELADDYED